MACILLTGASGLLGQTLIRNFNSNGHTVIILNRPDMNKLNFSEVYQLDSVDVIVHCAALTDLAYCNQNQKFAYSSNVELTRSLVNLAQQYCCKFIYISSAGVYGDHGVNEIYTESSPTLPTNTHHLTKLLGEKIVSCTLDNYLIFRVGWLFSFAESDNDFIAKIVKSLDSIGFEESIVTNKEQFGNPTSVEFVSNCINSAISSRVVGVYNLASSDTASRSEYVSYIVNYVRPDVLVKGKTHESFTILTKASINEMVSSDHFATHFNILIPTWKEMLSSSLSNRSF